jgi:hypothetical protein
VDLQRDVFVHPTRWAPSALPAGQKLREPKPLFRKVDPERVVAGELARMEATSSTTAPSSW